MEIICRKLRLQPGELLIEAGSGWGHLAMFAVKNYGVKVRSYNISEEQVSYATERAKKIGLGKNEIEFIHDDYRSIADLNYWCDKFLSVGMLEHVGIANYTTFFEIIDNCLRKDGLALIHFISKNAPRPPDPWLEKHIFPGGYVPSLGDIIPYLEKHNRELHIVDIENIRYHYSLTIDKWYQRFMKHEDEIRKKYGEAFLRKFKLYLEGSAAAFRYGGYLVFQILLSNGYDNKAPLTRQHFMEASAYVN